MNTGIQFTGTLTPNQTQTWFTFNWPVTSQVIWYVMPLTPVPGSKVECSVVVEKGAGTFCTYFITVKNLTALTVTFEGRYAVLN